nr:anti-sigma factor [Ciceribacter sp. L1K22]
MRAAVAESRDRFLPLDTGIEPVEAGEGLWQRIEAGLSTLATTPPSATSPTDPSAATATAPGMDSAAAGRLASGPASKPGSVPSRGAPTGPVTAANESVQTDTAQSLSGESPAARATTERNRRGDVGDPQSGGPLSDGTIRSSGEGPVAAAAAQSGYDENNTALGPIPPGTATPANDNRAAPWRITALASLAATLVLAVGLAFSLLRTVDPVVIAVLLDEKGAVQAVVEDFGNENARVRLLADFAVPADKTIEVWTLPSKDVGPVSLGLLAGARSASLDGPPLPAPRDNQLYELTLEPFGGSPTGRPTGPILAKGFAREPL